MSHLHHYRIRYNTTLFNMLKAMVPLDYCVFSLGTLFPFLSVFEIVFVIKSILYICRKLL